MDTDLCRCGSGLRRVRCCDADAMALPGSEAVALLDAKALEAVKFFNEKNYVQAEALVLHLLELAPNQRIALRVLFEIRRAQSRQPAAHVLAGRLANLPGTPALRAAANLQLAQFLVGLGKYAAALEPAGVAMMAAPRDATTHHVLGVILTETGQPRPGERHYRRAITLLGQEDGMALANLAWNLKLQGRLDEAAALYGQALALRPDNKRGVGGFAQVEMARGDVQRAVLLLDEALARWPEDRTLRLLRAMADLTLGDAAAVLERLNDPVENLLGAELSTLGQAQARLGQIPEAVSSFGRAKKMLRERNGQTYEPAAYLKKAELYKAYFIAERMQPLPRAPEPASAQPVFLLGFPRSGSSLLEQFLALVPGFAPGDEGAPMAELAERVAHLAGTTAPYPEALDHALLGDGADIPAMLRDRYAQARPGLDTPDVRFVTNRASGNFWHLGLIKLLFPNAPVLHVIRHPLDIMLSILSQDRRLEANAHASIAAAARHYALSMEMIKHYRGQLTLRYMPVRYEDLVSQPLPTLRRVVAFIGVENETLPDEAALRANEAPRRDPTPAHYAAREPLHTRGRYRHLEYRAQMPNLFAEVQEILQPWIDELGYGDAP